MNELATIGGGCYWCLEAIYQRLKGVERVTSGYSGGHTRRPTAEQVYGGQSGHAEVVQLQFKPQIIDFRQLIEIFFVMHDPTSLNRQGDDIGDEYRSVIFYHSPKQQQIAVNLKTNFASSLWPGKIVTEIVPFTEFWPADKYMQDFYNRNREAGYCQVVIDPKIQKLRQKFAKLLIPGL